MSTIHSSWVLLGCRSWLRCGTARFRTVRSIAYRRHGRVSTARLIHSRRPACRVIDMFTNSTLRCPPVGRLSARCRMGPPCGPPAARGSPGYPDLVRFGLLGTLAAWTENGRLVEVPEAKVRALLADLLIHLGRPVSADRLIDDLWGDHLPVHPTGALHSKVSRLRQALENAEPGGGELVAFRSPGYLLRLERDALDERRFAALTERARATGDLRDRAGLLADALALWRGPPLADFADAMFAQGAIAQLEEQRLAALEDQAETRLALGEHSLLAGELGELVARHPL